MQDSEPYLQLLNGLFASSTRTGDLDQVSGGNIGQFVGISRLANGVVRTRARELNLSTGAVLEVVKVLSAATNERAVLGGRDLDTEDDAVPQVLHRLLKLGLDLGDELRFTAQLHLVRVVTRTWAMMVCQNMHFL